MSVYRYRKPRKRDHSIYYLRRQDKRQRFNQGKKDALINSLISEGYDVLGGEAGNTDFARVGNAYHPLTGQTLAEDVLRQRYLSCAGKQVTMLLSEASRTNLIIYSEDVSQSNWGKSRTYIAGTETIKGIDFQEVKETAETGWHNVGQAPTAITPGSRYTASFFLKKQKVEDRNVCLNVANATLKTENARLFVNTETGEIVSQTSNAPFTIHHASVTDMGDRWRVIFSFDCGPTIASIRYRIHATQGTSLSYAGDGVRTVFTIGGSQLEEGNGPTSYFKTESIIETRLLDKIEVDFSFDSQAGTFLLFAYWEDYVESVDDDGMFWQENSNNLLRIFNGARIEARRNDGTVRIQERGTPQRWFQPRSLAVVCDWWDISTKSRGFRINGEEFENDNQSIVPPFRTLIGDIGFGQNQSQNFHFNGWIGALYFDRKLTQEEHLTLRGQVNGI